MAMMKTKKKQLSYATASACGYGDDGRQREMACSSAALAGCGYGRGKERAAFLDAAFGRQRQNDCLEQKRLFSVISLFADFPVSSAECGYARVMEEAKRRCLSLS
jgi:hypothetical protein